MVVIDSTVWIHYLRTPDTPIGQELVRLLNANEVAVVGMVLAEVLQGARVKAEVDRLEGIFRSLPFLEGNRETWATAGKLAFQLRREGRAVPVTDLAVAAVAMEHDCTLYTLDQHFQRIPGLKLHEIPND